MINLFKGDKDFYIKLVSLALPIALQNFIMSALNMVDTVMIGQLGEVEIASVALANQIFFLLTLLLFGISSGASIFNAQFWGKKDIPNIRRILGLSVLCSSSAAAVFTAAAFFTSRQLLAVFSTDTQVIGMGSSYMRIVCLSYIMTAVSFCYSSALRSTGNVKLPMLVSMFALGINTFLNYLLIFGKFGFPMLGVEGAAIATVIARLVEMTLILLAVYSKRLVPAASIKELLDIKLGFIKMYFKTALPVIMNEVLWSTGVTLYSVAYARMGTGVIASINISSTVERISLVLFFGISSACAVMVGNKIGEGDENTASLYARRLAVLGPALGILFGTGVIISSGWILSIYNVSAAVYEDARRVLSIFGIVMAFKVFNVINVVGILRGGGDTKFGLFIDTAGIWLISVPLAFLGGLVWSLPVYIVYALVNLEEVFKIIFGIRRLASGKWVNNLVQNV